MNAVKIVKINGEFYIFTEHQTKKDCWAYKINGSHKDKVKIQIYNDSKVLIKPDGIFVYYGTLMHSVYTTPEEILLGESE